MRTPALLAISALSLIVSAPVFAGDPMMKDGMHTDAMAHMSAADTRRIQRCNAMTHDRMMHNRTCVRLMQMHPDMMHHET